MGQLLYGDIEDLMELKKHQYKMSSQLNTFRSIFSKVILNSSTTVEVHL